MNKPPPASATTPRFYDPGLDILRFIAFLMVFFSHALVGLVAYATPDPGWVEKFFLSFIRAGAYGVDVFFLLSSYLITSLLIREFNARGHIDIFAFYIRRALRIWPLYFSFLVFGIIAFPHILPAENFPSRYRLPFLAFYGNWACAVHGFPESALSLLWSISMEEQFYILWPMLLIIFEVKRIPLVAVGMLAISFLTHGRLAYSAEGFWEIWCNTFARLEPIALGAIVAFYADSIRVKLGKKGRQAGIGVSLLIFPLAAWIAPQFKGPASVATYALAALASAGLLICLMGGSSSPAEPLSDFKKTLVHLGRISYGLYVFHAFVLKFFGVHPLAPFNGIETMIKAVVAFALTVILAEISYRWLERPFLTLKSRFTHVPSGAPSTQKNGHSERSDKF